jgi:hypothetical protein
MTDIEDVLQHAVNGATRNAEMILENIGLRVNVSELPDYMAYMDYRYNAPLLLIIWRRLFRKAVINDLHIKAQQAFLNAVMDQAKGSSEGSE